MTCDFMSFSTIFQSYQDDGQRIMEGCVQMDPQFTVEKFRLERGSNPGLLDQWARCLTH